MKKILVYGVAFGVVMIVGFLAIQLVPYGKDHTNSPVVTEPKWDSPKTRELAKRACFDCHSNEVVYPWYSNIAPVSWLVQFDIDRGRKELNFSNMRNQRKLSEAAENIRTGKMPEFKYLIMHPNATLTADEKKQLIDSFNAMSRQ
jgi:hypothetical protein